MVGQLALHIQVTGQIQTVFRRDVDRELAVCDLTLDHIVFLTATSKFYTHAEYLSVILTHLGLVHLRAFLVELALFIGWNPHGLLHHVVVA